MRYMPKPVTVTIDVPQDRANVYEFLDVMANHESFTDHLLRDWDVSGPERGVGAKARVHTKALGVTDVVDIEVVSARAPECIVERNVAQKAGRTGEGTYTLTERPEGGTHIAFEYRWVVTPLADRVTAPLARAFIRKANATAMRRLAERLASADREGSPAAA
jgi:Polyketide cyclase / dehydrase and lipid transport